MVSELIKMGHETPDQKARCTLSQQTNLRIAMLSRTWLSSDMPPMPAWFVIAWQRSQVKDLCVVAPS